MYAAAKRGPVLSCIDLFSALLASCSVRSGFLQEQERMWHSWLSGRLAGLLVCLPALLPALLLPSVSLFFFFLGSHFPFYELSPTTWKMAEAWLSYVVVGGVNGCVGSWAAYHTHSQPGRQPRKEVLDAKNETLELLEQGASDPRAPKAGLSKTFMF
ncbi:hypothetical protein B0T24DRAFT_188126 [Lasiosphaeria ovina]|uniref:Uncharacterized protein n=1 Tax=Lasiosphaeria ovina TaxID=92902 RepID=A0AAE0TUA0_9PEZI|nr:hypothetical protein B0T24DRAFT_188126 [Lasiosphaeria ovina]